MYTITDNHIILLTNNEIYDLSKYIGCYILVYPIIGKSIIYGKLMKLIILNKDNKNIIELKTIIDGLTYEIYPSNSIYVYNDKDICKKMCIKYDEKYIDTFYIIFEGNNLYKIIYYINYFIKVYDCNKKLKFSGKITNIKYQSQNKCYNIIMDNNCEVIYMTDVIAINLNDNKIII